MDKNNATDNVKNYNQLIEQLVIMLNDTNLKLGKYQMKKQKPQTSQKKQSH